MLNKLLNPEPLPGLYENFRVTVTYEKPPYSPGRRSKTFPNEQEAAGWVSGLQGSGTYLVTDTETGTAVDSGTF